MKNKLCKEFSTCVRTSHRLLVNISEQSSGNDGQSCWQRPVHKLAELIDLCSSFRNSSSEFCSAVSDIRLLGWWVHTFQITSIGCRGISLFSCCYLDNQWPWENCRAYPHVSATEPNPLVWKMVIHIAPYHHKNHHLEANCLEHDSNHNLQKDTQ